MFYQKLKLMTQVQTSSFSESSRMFLKDKMKKGGRLILYQKESIPG